MSFSALLISSSLVFGKMPVFIQQFVIVDCVTFSQASPIKSIASLTFNLLK
jgi:hypothetical protein